jgi:hypothetical protein
MDPNIYKVIHLAGVIILFGALGASIYTSSNKDNKLAAILHGISLLLILVSGFGLIARIWGSQWQWWMFVKMAIWLLLGGAYTLGKKRLISENTTFGIVLALGILAALLGNWPYLSFG